MTDSATPAPAEAATPAPAEAARDGILASLLRDRGMWFYGAATLLGAPLWLVKKWRLWRHLKLESEFDPARLCLRFPARLGAHSKRAPVPHATGPRVMIFTPGWGDVATIRPLVEALRAARPDVCVSFTTKHHEAIVPASRLSDEEVSPLPFDNVYSVAQWLGKTRPDVVVFYERFFYATLLRALWLRAIPFVIVHARMRRSTSRSAPNVIFKKWQLRGLRAICLSTPEYEPGVRQLVQSQGQIQTVGSIKFLHQTPAMAPEPQAALHAWIKAGAGDAPIFMVGSTSPGEDEWTLEALEIMRRARPASAPAPVLLLAPRDPRRAESIAELIRARGLTFSRRSQPRAARADVLLLDTMGELRAAYQWAMGTLVGGTITGNAHNVAEPLVWSVPVAFGPRRGNFETEQRLCEAAGVGFRVHSPAELAAHWTALLDSPALRHDLKAKIDALNQEQSRAFERTLQVLIDAVDAVDAVA